MHIDSVKQYIASSAKTPFFLFVGDELYTTAMSELSALGLSFVHMSSFCSEIDSDKIPDIDRLISHIESADINMKDKKFVVVGLGEHLAFRGVTEISSTLSRLKDLNIGGAKVVLLLRGIAPQVVPIFSDPRFDDRRFMRAGDLQCDISISKATQNIGLKAMQSFKELLVALENGSTGNFLVKTSVNFENAVFSVQTIKSAYEGIVFFLNRFPLPETCGTDECWIALLKDLNEFDGEIDNVFTEYGLNGNIESNFYVKVAGTEYKNWLHFIFLKLNAETLENSYLQYVTGITNKFEDFSDNILNAIIEIPHTNKQFPAFYEQRKVLVEKYPESDVVNFILNNRKILTESIYKLTDCTKVERKEMIAWVSKCGFVQQIDTIYPAFAAYSEKYLFKCPALSELLTYYFEDYKKQKIANHIEDDFLAKVDELALSRPYNRLPTRNQIIDKIEKNETFLYWLDGLGVEYLGLIEKLARKKGLSLSVNIARAELPTITTKNRGFFDEWQGQKEKDEALDDVKHNASGGDEWTDKRLPSYMADELDIIVALMDRATTELALRKCKRFLIVSDHGASRLAVLRRKEEKYDTDTTGEHSGRCCKAFSPYELPFAAEENGYIVLADYGRFRGSRAANIEVHGGASLEEVVVPIIELTLKDCSIRVDLVEDIVSVDRTGASFNLFVNTLFRW